MHVDIYPIEAIGKGAISAMAKPESSDRINAVMNAIAARGVTRVVSLLEASEANDLGLQHEQRFVQRNHMQFVQFSIPDLSVPTSVQKFCQFIKQQHNDVETGDHILVHCRAGIGRTGMVTASVLMRCGYEPLAAFARVSEKRGVTVPDLQAQIDWVVENQQQIVNA